MLAFLQWILAVMLSQPVPGWTAAEVSLPGTAATFAAAAALATFVGVATLRRVRARPDVGPLLVGSAVARGRVVSLAAFGLLAQSFGLATLPGAVGVEGVVLVPHVVRLLPFLALRLLWRAAVEPARRTALRGSFLSAAANDAKVAMLPVLPLFALTAAFDLLAAAPPDSAIGRAAEIAAGAPSIQALGGLAVLSVLLLAFPFVLRLVLRAKPLPDGPLRRRLDAYSRRVGFTARDILVWPTARPDGAAALNAAVVGVLGPFRYVFVTDGLLAALDDDEVEAVFAHEAGHGRRGHVLLFLAFSATVVLAGFLPGGLGDAFESAVAPVPPVLRGVAFVLLWMGVVLGWLSRRFEQEADVFGVETLPPARREDGSPVPPEEHPFVRALERIAAEVGGIREVTGWRHFSISDRVAFIREYLTDAAVRRRHKVRLGVLRGVLVVLPLLAVGAAAVRVPQDLEAARARGMLTSLGIAVRAEDPATRARAFAAAARSALASGRTEDALRWYRAALLDGAGGDVRAEYAEALAAAGRPLGAALLGR